MSFSGRLIHTLSVERATDIDTDDYGQAVSTWSATSVRGLPQPKSIREQALTSEAGAVVGHWTIFLEAIDLAESDRIVHDPTACSVPGVRDLPHGTFHPTGIRNAAGIGHHLEVDAELIAAVPAEGS